MLRAEQRRGYRRAFQPRLPIDNIDNIMEEFVLRMVEGMPGANLCKHYQFIDSRTR